MTVAILGIVGTVLSFAVWLWKRKATNADTPEARLEKNRNATAREIIKDDEDAANARLDDQLNRLRSRKSDSSRQGD